MLCTRVISLWRFSLSSVNQIKMQIKMCTTMILGDFTILSVLLLSCSLFRASFLVSVWHFPFTKITLCYTCIRYVQYDPCFTAILLGGQAISTNNNWVVFPFLYNAEMSFGELAWLFTDKICDSLNRRKTGDILNILGFAWFVGASEW